jgi:hypothetical protein
MHEDSETVHCECENISVGIQKVVNSRYQFYVTASYSESPPRIYELKKEA